MFPVLFEIPLFGGIHIYSYGVLVASGFVLGILWTVHEAKIAQINPDLVLDLSFYIILSALIGSRILYIFVDWDRYVAHPMDVLKIWEGGLVFYGGFIGATLTSLYYLRKHKMGFLKTADLFMPGLALGHAIGRLGCFAAGCCYGRHTDSFLAVTFPYSSFSLAPPGLPIFPSQLFESAAELLIFLVLIFFRRKKKFEGEIFLIYLVLYSVSRSILETFRGDSVRGFIIPGWLSTSQLISGCLIAIAAVIYFRLHRRQTITSGKTGEKRS
jgi:phosphatidylglycerol:prolipoprotein diacylglycerol transferase